MELIGFFTTKYIGCELFNYIAVFRGSHAINELNFNQPKGGINQLNRVVSQK